MEDGKYTIALDLGSSFVKGALFCNGVMKRSMQKRSPSEGNKASAFALTAREIVTALVQDVKEAKLCVSNAMHGFVLADDDFLPVADYISWQDDLCTVDALAKEVSAEDVRRTGMPLLTGFGSVNLHYLKRTGALPAGKRVMFGTLGDYVICSLAKKRAVCHPTNAAATGLYDITAGCWSKTLLDVCATGDISFPDVGEKAIEFDLNGTHITALPAIGDQQAALLGADVTEGVLSFNTGTGGQVSMALKDMPPLSEVVNDVQVRPYFGLYIKTIPNVPSGRALSVWIRFVTDVLAQFGYKAAVPDVWNVLLREASAAKDIGLKCDIGTFPNAYTGGVLGSVTGIPEEGFTVGALFKSVLTSLVDGFIWAAGQIVPSETAIHSISLSGGLSHRIPFIKEAIEAHYSGVPVTVAQDETMRGLVMYGDSIKGTV